MSLGRFGGSAPHAIRTAGGGAVATGDLLEAARDRLTPSPEGMPALSHQLAQALASYGVNLLKNGSMESWSGGTSAAPDGWTLAGAGATVARNTTSGQIQDSLASCNVTAALNTVTRLSQTLTLSATQNTRLRSRQVVLSARVLVSTASRVSMELDDGVVVTSSPIPHTGSGAFETVTVTITVDSAATQLKASLLISSGASITATVDAVKLEEGATATTFSESPRDGFLQPRLATANSSQTTSSTTFATLDSMSLATVIVDGTQSVLIIATVALANNTANTQAQLRIRRGSTVIGPPAGGTGYYIFDVDTVNQEHTWTIVFFDIKPAAGNYTYDLQWAASTASTTITARERAIEVIPIPQA